MIRNLELGASICMDMEVDRDGVDDSSRVGGDMKVSVLAHCVVGEGSEKDYIANRFR
jgi:hypothetical protein